MPAKKATRKKPAKAKRVARNQKSPAQKKKTAAKPPTKKLAKKNVTKKKVTKSVTKKNVTKNKAARKAKPAASKPAAKKSVARKLAPKPTKPHRGKQAVTFSLASPDQRSGLQSGDLQGLSGLAGADSESVNELAEEGNSFEAAAVKGVEDAGDGKSVRTHEVLEDDVPEEYLEQD